MLQATVSLAVSTIKRPIGNAQQLCGLLHLQILVFNRIQHALGKRLFPKLRSSSLREIIIHSDNVVPLFSLLVGEKD